MSGPTRTPTKILKLRGSWLAGTRDREPVPSGKPACPQWLNKDARAVWKQIVPKLCALHILGRIDQNALARYCTLWARWRAAELFIEKNGTSYPIHTETGKVKYHAQFPDVAIAHHLAGQLTKLEGEFGMTPASRSKIKVDVKPKDNAKSRFFNDGA